jgi:hypothetical protein
MRPARQNLDARARQPCHGILEDLPRFGRGDLPAGGLKDSEPLRLGGGGRTERTSEPETSRITASANNDFRGNPPNFIQSGR